MCVKHKCYNQQIPLSVTINLLQLNIITFNNSNTHKESIIIKLS